MMGRVGGVILQGIIGTVLTVMLAVLYFAIIMGMSPADAFLDQGIPRVLVFVDIGIVTWVVLLVDDRFKPRVAR
jgi:hypothetical protein